MLAPFRQVFRLWGEYSRTPKSALTRIMFNIARGLNFLHTSKFLSRTQQIARILLVSPILRQRASSIVQIPLSTWTSSPTT